MKITRPNYYEPHNYQPNIYGGWIESVKPYLIFTLLTAFFVYAVAGAAHWGQNHCHKQIKKSAHKIKHK